VQQVVVSGGKIRVVDVPAPTVRDGAVLVRTVRSLISTGTESAGLGTGGGGLVGRALRDPALVRKVLERVSSHGLRQTADLVRGRLASELPTGYSSAGVVVEVGAGVERFRVGERVACCGAGYSNHAELNVVPQNLAAHVPDNVSFDDAAFGTLGAIALHGVRRCAPTLGDRVLVLGLGLLGQITVQLLRASGVVTLGVDVRSDRLDRARSLGLSDGFTVGERDLVAGVRERTDDQGADAVIVTAATGDLGFLGKAFDACRKKGRVVLVGDVPIRIPRDKIYAKEIDFFVSTSYGPGRYDADYEEKGHDYPFAYVRWTEGRNLEEVLRLIARGALNVQALIDRHAPIAEAEGAYASLSAEPRPIAVLFDYPDAPAPVATRAYTPQRTIAAAPKPGGLGVGVVGYGSYFRSMLLPLIKSTPALRLEAVCARSGLSVRHAVEKDGFRSGTTDYRELLANPAVDIVYVTTRHNLHYTIARAAIEAGKPVFVEKPLTLTVDDGRALVDLAGERQALVSVGFNRRFSPHIARLKTLLAPIAAPKTLVYRVNAGALPPGHWLLDPDEGGGRLLGEGVHFFDLLCYLAGAEPRSVRAQAIGGRVRDEAICQIDFADGSVGSLIYTGGGAAAAGKERLEIFAGGATFIMDDYRSLEVYGLKAEGTKSRTIEKGQPQQLDNFLRAVRGEAPLGVTAADGLRATWCAVQAIEGAGKAHVG
jgi:predicted dehydrogenase/threonine dehydrogenase-like Zn-dependent dehydrogenase